MEVLFVTGGGIGNIIQSTPTIKNIAKYHTIDVKLYCDTKAVREIFSLPCIRRLYVEDNPTQQYNCQLRGIFAPGKNFKADKYYNTRVKYAQHVAESLVYQDLAKQIGIHDPLPDIEINIGKTGPKPESQETIAIYTGSKHNWAMKRWDKYDELVKHFKSVIVLGTRQDIESHGNPAWIKRPWKWPKHVKFFSGTLQEAAFLIAHCKMFIGNDGGLSHVAAATGTPTFVIFGPSSDVKNKPFAKKARVIAIKLHCRPCQFQARNGKPIFDSNIETCYNQMQCMRELSVDFVMNEIKKA